MTKNSNAKNHEAQDANAAKDGDSYPGGANHAGQHEAATVEGIHHHRKHHNKQDAARQSDAAGDAGTTAPCEDELKLAQSDISALTDQMVRLQADFENLRKRTQKERSETYRRAVDDVALDILPVLDNMERALAADAAVIAKGAASSIPEGIRLVATQLSGVLAKFGIVPMETVGKPFDPKLHEAISAVETADFVPNCVMAETRKGYTTGDRLLRAAQVLVSHQPSAAAPATGEGQDKAEKK